MKIKNCFNQFRVFSSFLSLLTVGISSTALADSMTEWTFNEYVEDVWVSNAILEIGTWPFNGECISWDWDSCTGRETIYRTGLKFRMGLSLPDCTGLTDLDGFVTVTWRGVDGNSFTQTENYGSADEGTDREFYHFWEGEFSETNGDLEVTAYTSCDFF